MAVNRKPGEKMYIDWVGDQPGLLTDVTTGEIMRVVSFASKYPRLADIYNKLEKQNTAINEREQQLANVEKELAETKSILNAKQRKELQKLPIK